GSAPRVAERPRRGPAPSNTKIEDPMLGTRLVIGLSMAGLLAAILFFDEWLAPWFPLWLLVTLVTLGSASLELVGLLPQTSARPSGSPVFAGGLALVRANWAPHLMAKIHQVPSLAGRMSYDPLSPVNSLAWPLLTFAAVVMATFIVQSAQFNMPGATMATI